jgi:hypothetical protein
MQTASRLVAQQQKLTYGDARETSRLNRIDFVARAHNPNVYI